MSRGRRGPAPLPSAIKKARGTEKSSRANKREPKPQLGEPAIPASIAANKEAAACWRSIVPRLLELKVLSKIDGIALEGMCQAYARAKSADAEVKKRGMLVKTSWGTLVQNPAVPISRMSWAEVRKFAQEFGLTPSSRSRVHAGNDESSSEGESSEDFLFGKGKVVGSIGR